jgi:hypothetical protein
MKSDVFQEACLLQLTASCWQGSRMLDPSVMEQIGNSDWLKGRKHLVKPEILNPVRAVIGRARKNISRISLPFPISGFDLIHKDQISRAEETLKADEGDFWAEVDKVEDRFEEEKAIARIQLGPHYSDFDYPSNIRTKFGFEWKYLLIETPGKHGILTPEIYEREKEKFKIMMEETRELAMAALRQELADHVSHIVERLSRSEDGKVKTFKNCMVEKIQDYLDVFDARNLFGDDKLAELVKQAKALIGGVSPEAIRENIWLKKSIAEGMGKIKQSIDGAIIDLPRRKIRLPGSVSAPSAPSIEPPEAISVSAL